MKKTRLLPAGGLILAVSLLFGAMAWRQQARRRAAAGNESAGRPPLPAIHPEADNAVALVESLANPETRISAVERVIRANTISTELSEADCRALYDYLREKENDSDDHAVKNDIMNRLRNQKNPSPELAEVLLAIFYDKEQDIVMRSYALQHLRACYLFQNMRSEKVMQAFYDGLEERDSEVSGVAILALGHLTRSLPEVVNQAEVATRAADLAGDEETNVLSRISAIGVCTNLQGDAALPVVRELARENVAMNLKIASIAALGKLGDHGDLELLHELAQGKRPYATAAKAALKTLNERNQQ